MNMSQVSLEKTVGEWVRERPSRSRVFERFGIDYCCGGKKPLGAACHEKGVSEDTVLAALDASDAAVQTDEIDWSQRTMTELCDHIVSRHHDRLRQELPRIEFMARKVAAAHGERHPELREVANVFDDLQSELLMHMRKEEEVLFPLIRQMEETDRVPSFHCGSLGMPISVMEHEHDNAGRALEDLRRLTGGHASPADACNTFRALLNALEDLEADMHQHVHKENNILFPAARACEERLTSGAREAFRTNASL
jgi:regulator of cell morphogenesis and NO signaling